MLVLILLLILIQFGDSFCAELYDKVQSLYLKDLLMVPKNMELEEATVLLNSAAIPFCVISALAPVSRVLVDYIGKKKVMLLSMAVLVIGCVICVFTNNWLVFLFGSALVAFGCSVDMQYIYIVDEIKANFRGTVRGVLAAVAALAGMTVAFVRNPNWRSLYIIGLIMVTVIIIISILLLPKGKLKDKEVKKEKVKEVKISGLKENFVYLLPLFIWGIGVAGVTFYNEPIVAMTLESEDRIQLAMIIQPLVTTLITFISGFLSDRLTRKKVIFGDIIITLAGTVVFVMTAIINLASPVLFGMGWGMMIGGFFGATNLMLLVVTENAPAERIGRVSALSSYFNGAGTGVGMVLVSILGNIFSTGISKLLIITSVAVITILLIVFQKKRAS